MKSFLVVLVIAGLGVSAAPAFADAPKPIANLLEYQAEIVLPAGGGGDSVLYRLILPPQVTAATRADLSDIRIFDARGVEVPFLVDSGLRQDEVRRTIEVVDAKILDVRRKQFERQNEPPLVREEYEIEAPPSAADASDWKIEFTAAISKFVRTVEISPLGAEGAAEPSAHGTIYRLVEGDVRRVSVALPPTTAPRLRVVIEGNESAYLEPRISYRRVRTYGNGERVALPLEILRQRHEGGRTLVELARPNGLLPDIMRIETSTPAYYRRVQVCDAPALSTCVGGGTVFRVPVREVATETDIALSPVRGDPLTVEIVDDDSPPLENLKISAIVRQPALLFALAGDARPAMLRYGGGRIDRPRYDLANLSPGAAARRGELARIGELLMHSYSERTATLRDPEGEPQRNPSFDPVPLLEYAMHPGAPIDVAVFSHRRPVTIAPSPDGLTRIRLGAQDVSLARPDLGDVRIVDSRGRQWPYLLQRAAALEWIDAAVSRPSTKRGESRYEVALPFRPIELSVLELSVPRDYFHRQLRVVDGDRERPLAEITIHRNHFDARPISVNLPLDPVEQLSLVLADGDEAPLPIAGARLGITVPELFVTAPAGDYTLLIGDAQTPPPRYDLADARDAILSVRSNAVVPLPLEPNPAHGWRQELFARSAGKWQQAALWGVLAAAVAALALVTIRLVRREGDA